MLQHLRGGPISTEPVDIIPGARSVEVRPKGLTKGLTMQHIIGHIEQLLGIDAVCFDFVLCIGPMLFNSFLIFGILGHFLAKDENIFDYFDGVNMCKEAKLERTSSFVTIPHVTESDDFHLLSTSFDSGPMQRNCGSPLPERQKRNFPPVLSPNHLFTCTVGRNESRAK